MSNQDFTGETAGFSIPRTAVDLEASETVSRPPMSPFSAEPAVPFAHLQRLESGEGSVLFHPTRLPLGIGDVLYLRERSAPNEEGIVDETGVVVQVISIGTARYPAAEEKSLFRLMTAVRAAELSRSFHEPPETLDEFMEARVRIRASILHGVWTDSLGQSVTRNVDVFAIKPSILLSHITQQVVGLNLFLGDHKGSPINVFGGGFEKVNLITGMKGAGKSHIAKGVIDGNRLCGVSSIVFDVNENDAYDQLPEAHTLRPGQNLKFRLDRMHPEAFLRLMMRLAPPGEQTQYQVYSRLPDIIRKRIAEKFCPDVAFLRAQDKNVIQGSGGIVDGMRASYTRSLDVVEASKLFMTHGEATSEREAIQAHSVDLIANPVSLSAVAAATLERGPSVLVIKLAELTAAVQRAVVQLIIEHVKEICDRLSRRYDKDSSALPIYPSIFFEEAHMYMDDSDIDALVPVIRHIGPNLFFVTNTPDALPDSVIRLVDNLVLTRLINSKDVNRIQACGLTDSETLESFARDLPKHYALLLSGLEGSTNGFPLVFHVRDFGLPVSGATRSVWKALEQSATTRKQQDDPKPELSH